MWVSTGTEEKALKLCDRVLGRMRKDAHEKSVEPYTKTGGFVVSFTTELVDGRWNDAVVEAISLGQRVGDGWTLSGGVEDDPACWSDRTNVSGVEAIEWSLRRSSVDNAG